MRKNLTAEPSRAEPNLLLVLLYQDRDSGTAHSFSSVFFLFSQRPPGTCSRTQVYVRAVAGLAIVRAGELGLFPRGVSSELRKRGGFFLTGALPD